MDLREFTLHAVAGTLGGVAGVWTGSPLDVVKVRLQTGAGGGGGLASTFRDIVRREGVHGFFKGAGASSLSQAPNNAIIFASYGGALRYLEKQHAAEGGVGALPLRKLYVAGCWSGFIQAFGLAPFEHVKVQQQVLASGEVSLRECASGMVRRGGLPLLFRGTAATLLRDGPTFGVYFASFEACKRAWAQRAGFTGHGNVSGPGGAGGTPPAWVLLAGGGVAGALSWAVALPADVVKSLIQSAPLDTPRRELRMSAVARRVFAAHGLRGFFRGFLPCVVRAVPVNATCFFGYEGAYELLDREFPAGGRPLEGESGPMRAVAATAAVAGSEHTLLKPAEAAAAAAVAAEASVGARAQR